MRSVVLAHPVDFDGWRSAARRLAVAAVLPEQVVWSVGEAQDLFAAEPPPEDQGTLHVPRAFMDTAMEAIQVRDPERFALLYRLLWRIQAGARQLMQDPADPDVQRALRWTQAVRRDIHKMHAFVRFREVATGEGTRYVAWFEPEHYTLEAGAPFFARRFATMVWSILTPYRSAHWDGETLRLGPGAAPDDVPDDDALEAYWRAYFSSIFNPARLKTHAMLSEMPRKYWRNLPETAAIPALIRDAHARTRHMVEEPMISPARPAKPRPLPVEAVQDAASTPLDHARHEIVACRRCALWEHATQPVFGEGPVHARLMLVGEQPGDQEDLAGRPFVGPAGQLLDRALEEAGIDRQAVYVTNAVKHFKFTPRGKRRIHEKPDTTEIAACGVWLNQERQLVQPAVTVLLGASAARAVLGRTVTIGRERGQPITMAERAQALVTVHPSYLLRLPDQAAKTREYGRFVEDLLLARRLVG